jgi:hypothetical protein
LADVNFPDFSYKHSLNKRQAKKLGRRREMKADELLKQYSAGIRDFTAANLSNDYSSNDLTAKSPKVTVKLCCCPEATKVITDSQATAVANSTKFLASG